MILSRRSSCLLASGSARAAAKSSSLSFFFVLFNVPVNRRLWPAPVVPVPLPLLSPLSRLPSVSSTPSVREVVATQLDLPPTSGCAQRYWLFSRGVIFLYRSPWHRVSVAGAGEPRSCPQGSNEFLRHHV
ncbi:hypothetical protein PAXRUDRAFT_822097 [Paxillus rubicundulus Ve08.2h10]|uniref:Unplaced genomic scaffold scaffold_22, whole genome shotgun sequence n=1 Tax=Paxillus rubicundulus Ve08.2h10 TaxID=930991 RepID=A0A0D0E5M7_9AGAM|nr:hypothetical protein PAXRUDRAFT_822097 [Paxillus rubicundulus Ve08.2h10]